MFEYIYKKYYLPQAINDQLPKYLPYFLTGMLYIINWDIWRKLKNKQKVIAISIDILLLTIIPALKCDIYSMIKPLVIGNCCIFLADINVKDNFPYFLIKFDNSYIVYLIHCLIIVYLMEKTHIVGIPLFLTVTGLSVILGWSIQYGVEKFFYKRSIFTSMRG